MGTTALAMTKRRTIEKGRKLGLECAWHGPQLLHDPGDIGVRTEFHDLSRRDSRDEDDL
jgi:hypothetical protein